MSRFELVEDFVSPVIDSDFVFGAHAWEFLGVGGSRAGQASEAGAPGILRLTTGNVNGNNCILYMGSVAAGDQLLAGISYFSFRLRTSSATSQILRFGFGDDLTNGNFGSNGLYFDQDTSGDGFVHMVARNAGAESDATTAGSVLNSGFRTFEFLRGAAASWHAYQVTSGGTRNFLGSRTSNITSNAVAFGIRIETLTNAARSIDIDLIRLRSVALARR